MTNYSDLKLLAEAATRGPWIHGGNWVSTEQGNSVADCSRGDEKFIAAANPTAVLALIAENERLQESHEQVCTNYNQVSYASEERGKQIDKLKAENEALRKTLVECSDSLHGEMLQKFGGQLPDEMHPVTRRDYDRDMEEVGGYRAALINAAMSKQS